MLLLDSLYPTWPDNLVANCQAVGAGGSFVYVSRPGGVGDWTPAHVTALRAAGLVASPIIVPPSFGGDISFLLAAAQGFGFSGGPITLDLETPNLPPAAWEEEFDAAARAAGFWDLDYGTSTDLGLYQPDDEEWLARWIESGTLAVIPSLPAGLHAWQFVNDVPINGVQYDVSVVDPAIFSGPVTPASSQGGDGMAIARHPTQQRADIFWPGPSGVQHRTYDGVAGAPSGAPDGYLLNPAQHSENLGGDPVTVLGACWINERYLHVVIVDRSTGDLEVNEFDLQSGAGWSGWATVPDQAADLSRLQGPKGDPGPPGTVASHAHDVSVSGTASLSGTSGPAK